LMMNARATELVIFVDAVKNVPLDEEVFDGSRAGVRNDSFHRPVTNAQICGSRSALVIAMRYKVDHRHRFIRREELHLRMKIRKFVGSASSGHGDRARSVEAEKPHARITAVAMDIRADVDLVKRRDPWQGRRQNGPPTRGFERNQPDQRL